MILADGKIFPSEEILRILPSLEKRICKTLAQPVLQPMKVIEACDRLASRFEQGKYNQVLQELYDMGHVTKEQIHHAISLFRRESLLYKMQSELGVTSFEQQTYLPLYGSYSVRRKLMPLGVLFHIAAGNVDGLPAYSVVEGLLSGNINILKLPAADNGFTLKLLEELINIEPLLKEYIYVFDTSSNDVASMKALAKSSDGIVVWGGDMAIEAVRKLATPNTKIIEWGHKLSFAYITEQGMKENAFSHAALFDLAHHILSTRQLLCSSCQGIYLDSEDLTFVYAFCERFLPILDQVSEEYPKRSIGMEAQITLLLHSQELEASSGTKKLYRGKHCSLLAHTDKKLQASFTYGNCWVRALPRRYIITALHRYKGYLQTVGLLCGEDERESLSELLCKAGATRITPLGDMSRMLCGETHDGEYPLRRYMKVVEF